jgi:hypothetical protein
MVLANENCAEIVEGVGERDGIQGRYRIIRGRARKSGLILDTNSGMASGVSNEVGPDFHFSDTPTASAVFY